MHMRIMLFAAFLALAGLAEPVYAGESGISIARPASMPAERIVPHGGGWWNPMEGGSGYFLEFMPNADGSVTGFATTYTYDDAGKSTFLIVQGPVVFSSEEERLSTGIVARMSSPLYKAENGQPFGGAYRPASVTASGYGVGEYVFFTRRTGEFRAGGRVTPIQALSALGAAQEYAQMLTGTWRLQGRLRRNPEAPQDATMERAVSHIVRIEPSAVQPAWSTSDRATTYLQPAALRAFWRPPSNVMTFTVTCVGECAPVPHPLGDPYQKIGATYGARIWVDLATGKAGYVTAAQPNGGDPATAYWATNENLTSQYAGGQNYTFDLFVDDSTLVGRGGIISTVPYWLVSFTPGSEVVLTKMDPKTAFVGDIKIY